MYKRDLQVCKRHLLFETSDLHRGIHVCKETCLCTNETCQRDLTLYTRDLQRRPKGEQKRPSRCEKGPIYVQKRLTKETYKNTCKRGLHLRKETYKQTNRQRTCWCSNETNKRDLNIYKIDVPRRPAGVQKRPLLVKRDLYMYKRDLQKRLTQIPA